MNRKHNKLLTPNARELRKNMTKQEKHLWNDYLRTYPIRILRQKIISNYIADFYCAKAKLVIEIDGLQHYTEDGLGNDEERTKFLNAFDLKVIRFSNIDVDRNFNIVCQTINKEISKRVVDLTKEDERSNE
jgi:very-short-patch-repair endonuclease